MGKVTFNSLKQKMNEDIKTFEINDKIIEVKQYLPVEKKYDIIMVALQNAKSEGIYNELKLSMYLELYLVYSYTNITFTDKQRESEDKLYDILQSNGIIEKVISLIPENEMDIIYDSVKNIKEDFMKYNYSIVSSLDSFVENLKINAEDALKIVENFDKEKFQNVIDFAEAANGGRPIN